MNHPKFLLALKLIIFILMTWFIAEQLFLKNDFSEQVHFFLQNLNGRKFYLLLMAVFLMPVNWLLETFKWRVLIQSKSSWSNLVKSVVAGITIGFVTPGRTGEFIGRVMFLDGDEKAKTFYLSSIGGIAQSAASLVPSVFFVVYWNASPLLTGMVIGLAAGFLMVYYRFDLLNRYVSVVPFLERRNLIIDNEQLPDISTQTKVLFISFLRYCVYLNQYVLLMVFFGVNTDFFVMLIHSGVFLAVQTFSPLMPLLDISFRGGTALWVFKDVSSNSLAVLSAVTFVWLLNLVIPAVAGYLFILNKRTLVHAVQ